MRHPARSIARGHRRLVLSTALCLVMGLGASTWAQPERRHGTIVDLQTGALSTYRGTTARGTIIDLQTGNLSTYDGNARRGTILDLNTGGLSTYQLYPNGGGTVLDLETGRLGTFGK